MTHIISILPDHVINKIAAGEVVERPASVVKELIENSLDAGATDITIDIEQAGNRLIRIADNGCGMSREDAYLAFERHATSKIASDADLESVRTMGFRGEALSSIASVSHVRLLTAERGAPSGTLVEMEGGKRKAASDAAAPQGTSIEISHLFFNTPARLKFLKSPTTEFSHILTAVSRQAMARPAVRFRLTHNKKPVLDLPSSQGLQERTFQLYGSEIAENLVAFVDERDAVRIEGLLGRAGFSRADKTYQDFYVNRRAVKNPSLAHALYSAYGDMLMRDRHPVAFISIDIDPALVDVNVHPAKAEVRFRNQSQIHDLVREVIRGGLRAQGVISQPSSLTEPDAASGVREALSDYFATRPSTTPVPEQGRFSHLFGRRKSDGESNRSSAESAVYGQNEPAPVQHQFAGLPNHGLFPLAQVHDSFILAQSREGMVIIDQHAAHERVLFEKLQDQFSGGHVELQHLLVPDQLELGPAQGGLLAEYLPELGKLGLVVEDYGNNTFMIKAVPALLAGMDCKRLILDLLDEMNVHGRSRKMDELRSEILSVMACHPAIKVHRRLDIREMERLIADLFQCRMPHTCPHGRPTMIKFSMDEIKKLFKRI